MESTSPSSESTPPAPSLPPVEPPSARFILQLFLVPGILVAVVVAFIWLFFGWVGGGPQTADEFIEALKSHSKDVRWRAAQDLAQLLPRREDLRCDMKFGLDLAAILQKELETSPAKLVDTEPGEKPEDLVEFLPACLGSFHAPIGLSLLEEIVAKYATKIEEVQPAKRQEGDTTVYVNVEGLRLRNAVMALSLQGARLAEFDQLPQEAKDAILSQLRTEMGTETARQKWAKQAEQFVTDRMNRDLKAEPSRQFDSVAKTLDTAARVPDEITRKFAALALANWPGPAFEEALYRMTFGDDSLRIVEDKNPERARREIRFNAALALARRGSSRTPWSTVLETLDEKTLQEKTYATNPGMASRIVVKSLNDLRELKRVNPALWASQAEVQAAVEKLVKDGSPAAQVGAAKLFGETKELPAGIARMSRELLMIIGLGVAVLVLLLLAVVARWRRKPAAVAG